MIRCLSMCVFVSSSVISLTDCGMRISLFSFSSTSMGTMIIIHLRVTLMKKMSRALSLNVHQM